MASHVLFVNCKDTHIFSHRNPKARLFLTSSKCRRQPCKQSHLTSKRSQTPVPQPKNSKNKRFSACMKSTLTHPQNTIHIALPPRNHATPTSFHPIFGTRQGIFTHRRRAKRHSKTHRNGGATHSGTGIAQPSKLAQQASRSHTQPPCKSAS